MESIGDRLYSLVFTTKGELFQQSRMAQLTYQAFDKYVQEIDNLKEDEIKVSYPVGYRPSKEAMFGEIVYTKDELKHEYNVLAFNHLPVNGIYKLVTLIEAMLLDILRIIITKYPQKLGNKRQIDISIILSSNSLEEAKLYVVNKFINELAYQSPEDFVKDFEQITSINLFETPVTHRYKEIKTTRDIYIHNMGIVNEIYIKKAGSHARAKIGENLPIDIQYFLESYEYCLQLCEFLETKLHEIWPSAKYEEKNQPSE